MKIILVIILTSLISSISYAQVGNWPANPSSFTYFGATQLNQALGGNYAVLQSQIDGSTFLNSPLEVRFRIGNSDKFILSNGGSVGIGTTSPGSNTKLNVVGGAIEITSSAHTADAALHISSAFGTYNRLTQIQPEGISKPGLNLVASTDASGTFNWWSWGVLTSGSWAFQPATSFGGSTGLFIDRSGNLSVGTSDPKGYKLAVAGKAVAEEVNVKLQASWPDYVFEKDYSLPSLESVQSYINQNKHLPEVPSAKEMEANGINLSEMNMLLLKKVEELTLYMIESRKEIESVRKENEELKIRMTQIERK